EDHPWVIAFLTELSIARPSGTDARLEGRTDPDGRRVMDPIFEAEDRAALTDFLHDYEQQHPRPPELVPVWEQHTVTAERRGPRWQLHFVDRQAGFQLDGGASALAVPDAEHPAVWLKFSPAQGEQFAALTRARVGRRLAFTIGDEVVNVPIVREPIPGGQAMLLGDASLGPERGAAALLERLQQAD